MGRERAMVIPHTNIPRNLCFACFCVKVRLGKHSGGSWVAFTHQSVSHTWLNLRNDISLGVWVARTSGITRSRHTRFITRSKSKSIFFCGQVEGVAEPLFSKHNKGICRLPMKMSTTLWRYILVNKLFF